MALGILRWQSEVNMAFSDDDEYSSPILENAIDSLEVGVRTYLYGEYETAQKHAILNVFHCIELLLKELLYTVHPLLIYKNIDRPINDDSPTVGFRDTLGRLCNIGVTLNPDEIRVLEDLQRRRNRIEHHKFEKDESHKLVVGKALRFIYYFLQDHLGLSLEAVLEDDLYQEARAAILSFEELLSEAERRAADQLAFLTKDDLIDGCVEPCVCPECGNTTVVIGSDYGDFCFFCHAEVEMRQCMLCAEYVGAGELGHTDVCDACFHQILSD